MRRGTLKRTTAVVVATTPVIVPSAAVVASHPPVEASAAAIVGTSTIAQVRRHVGGLPARKRSNGAGEGGGCQLSASLTVCCASSKDTADKRKMKRLFLVRSRWRFDLG